MGSLQCLACIMGVHKCIKQWKYEVIIVLMPPTTYVQTTRHLDFLFCNLFLFPKNTF